MNWRVVKMPGIESELTVNSENKPQGLYFLKALFKGLIFGGAYIRRGLSTEGNLRFNPYSWKEIYRFCFVLLCI